MSFISRLEGRASFARAVLLPRMSSVIKEVSTKTDGTSNERIESILKDTRYRVTAVGFIVSAQRPLTQTEQRVVVDIVGLVGSIDDRLDKSERSLREDTTITASPSHLETWILGQKTAFGDESLSIGAHLGIILENLDEEGQQKVWNFLHQAAQAHRTLLHNQHPTVLDAQTYREQTSGAYSRLLGDLIGVSPEIMTQFVQANLAVQFLDDIADAALDFRTGTVNPITLKAAEEGETLALERYPQVKATVPSRRSLIGKAQRAITAVQNTRELYRQMPNTTQWCKDELARYTAGLKPSQATLINRLASLVF